MAQYLPPPKKFKICTFNMYGLNQGAPTLSHLCGDVSPDVIFFQEHWQTPVNLKSILHFSPNYQGYGISAMEVAVQRYILRGRTYGGTATLIHNRWQGVSSVIVTSERFVIVKLGNMLFINVYLPSSSSKDANVMKEATHNEISGYFFLHLILFYSLGGTLM